MSIKYNGEVVAGKYKSQIIPSADTVNEGTIRIATQEEVDAGVDNTTAVTPYYLSSKQVELIAGDGISIEDNVITNTRDSAEWGKITGDITTQVDLQNSIQSLDNKIEENKIDISNLNTSVANLQDIKADKATTLADYGIEDAYTKDEVYSKDETYTKDEVYSKDETYPKEELYTKSEVYTKGEVYNINEVYNKDETYNKDKLYTKDELYSKSETYNKSEVDTFLDTKVDKEEGKSLISDTEIDRLSNVDNYDDTEVRNLIATKQNNLIAGDGIQISGETISAPRKADNVTIVENNDKTITTVGQLTKDGSFKFDWVGTNAEYTAGMLDGSISPDWYCYITDDEIDVDFENFLEAPKGYLVGNVLYDERGYNELVERSQSTFDISKFTIEGSPTISDDGIASGLNESNYINTYIATQNKSFSISFNVNYIASSSIQHFLRVATNDYGGSFGFLLRSNTDNTLYLSAQPSVSSTNVLSFGFHHIKITQEDKVLKLYVDNEFWCETTTTADLAQLYISWGIGVGQTIPPFDGSIDLKSLKVIVDGQEVFSGAKTGIDVIKASNYTVIGSPTISADGIASGFSASNYLKIPSFDISNGFIIEEKFRCNSVVDSQTVLSYTVGETQETRFGLVVFFYNSGKLTFNVTANGTSFVGNTIGNTTIHPNTDYILKLVYDGSKIDIYLSSDNGTSFILEGTKDVTLYSGLTTFKLGTGAVSTATNSFSNGSIDLNSVKIYTNSKLIYQPCLKIPYTLSKTGSKIVDASYRDRVQDVYEQYGEALYYTLDEENQNYTIPMGEVYGMIENRSGKGLPQYYNFYSQEDFSETNEDLVNASLGSYLSGNIYKTVYKDFISKIGQPFCAGTIKEYGDSTISDYDCVVKQDDMTFRLPLLNGDEDLPSGKFENLALKASGETYVAPANGSFNIGKRCSTIQDIGLTNLTSTFHSYKVSSGGEQGIQNDIRVKKGDTIVLTYTADGELMYWKFCHNKGNGNLYFKLSNVVQNQQILDVAGVTSVLNEMNAASRGYLVESYVNGASWYRVYSDGWCEQGGRTANIAYNGNSNTTEIITLMKPYKNLNYSVSGVIGNTIWLIPRLEPYTNSQILFECRNYVGETTGGYITWSTAGYIN